MNEWSFQRKEEEIDRSKVIRNGMYVQQCKQGDTTTSYTWGIAGLGNESQLIPSADGAHGFQVRVRVQTSSTW